MQGDVTGKDVRRGPIGWMAHNPVASNLVMILLLVGGLMSILTIKQELFPDFDLDIVTVSVSYPGASPEEVEQGIVLALEEALRGLDGVDEVESRASEGMGNVTVALLDGANAQKVYQDVQQEVDRISTFPEEAEEPRVSLASHKREVLHLVLYGDVAETDLRAYAEFARDRLLQEAGITQVELTGVRDYEIEIAVRRDVLRDYDLTLDEVARVVGRLAMELPGGGIKTDAGEILVRVRDRRDYGDEFARMPLLTADSGSPVLLGDIAEITDGFEDADRSATYRGKRAINIDVYRVGGQTPIAVSATACEAVEKVTAYLPPGLEIEALNDRSEIYGDRISLLLRNAGLGLGLVLLMLGVFLEARLAFWVMMGIPASFLGGLLLMPAMGLSINMISMFAFLIALGIVVDDAIVVGENVYERHQGGEPLLTAAVRGAREVAMPVTFSVLTNVVAFLPLMFVPGVIGKIWKTIPIVVITVFAISLGESLFVLPSHLGHRRRGEKPRGWLHERQQGFSRWFSRLVENRYGPFLRAVLRRRYLTTAVAVAMLIVTIGYVMSRRIGTESMPRVESDYSVVTATLPYGSPVERTEAVGAQLAAAAERVAAAHGADALLKGVYTEIGNPHGGVAGGHQVEVRANLTEADERPISTREFTTLWRNEVGAIAGLESLLFESDRGGPGSGAALSLELTHTDSDILDRAAEDLATALAVYPATHDIDDGSTAGKVQMDFRLRPEGLAMGLTASDIARQLRSSFYGAEALRQQRGRDEVKVMVRLPEAERTSENDLERFLVRTPAGTDVPLGEIATVTAGRAYTSIDRKDGRRVVTVTANVSAPSETSRILGEILAETVPTLQRRYPGLDYGFGGRQEDFNEGMSSLSLGFAVALLGIYALLAIPFRSYLQPLIVMVSIPFGVVGAVIGHVVMGYSLSVMSMMGIVALAGVVVNDSLVLIDYANRQRRNGASAFDAIRAAGVRRFRPILLTTLTTFGGLAPMIFETSIQARFMIPMALSLGFGIVFATAITLVLVPSLYLILDDLSSVTTRAGREATATTTPEAAETA